MSKGATGTPSGGSAATSPVNGGGSGNYFFNAAISCGTISNRSPTSA